MLIQKVWDNIVNMDYVLYANPSFLYHGKNVVEVGSSSLTEREVG